MWGMIVSDLNLSMWSGGITHKIYSDPVPISGTSMTAATEEKRRGDGSEKTGLSAKSGAGRKGFAIDAGSCPT